jgi:hypothetical protein
LPLLCCVPQQLCDVFHGKHLLTATDFSGEPETSCGCAPRKDSPS